MPGDGQRVGRKQGGDSVNGALRKVVTSRLGGLLDPISSVGIALVSASSTSNKADWSTAIALFLSVVILSRFTTETHAMAPLHRVRRTTIYTTSRDASPGVGGDCI